MASKQFAILDPAVRLNLNSIPRYAIWPAGVEAFLDQLPDAGLFDLVVTSPPHNLGKAYEDRQAIEDYASWQERVIKKCFARLQPTDSICWQVGNHILERRGGRLTSILLLDYLFHSIFDRLGLRMRNRIVWCFGHGQHCKRRFSGRYEVVLSYARTDDYDFDLDAVRIPSKYPGKEHYKGPRAGEYSSNPLGKNPEDVWGIPDVKSNHIEKTDNACQFPVASIERPILAQTKRYRVAIDLLATGIAKLAA
jgi:adenine-specific DNA-methyltransferase